MFDYLNFKIILLVFLDLNRLVMMMKFSRKLRLRI